MFGDEGPEAFISLSIKQHTLALIMARALRALRVMWWGRRGVSEALKEPGNFLFVYFPIGKVIS